MLKAELHTHTADDPVDHIPYSGMQLIDRAADLGYAVVAITLHDRQFDVRRLEAHARDRGVVLIPGIERTVEGKHVLLLNFPAGATEAVETFDDLARLRARATGLVIAPHPFFPATSCLRSRLDRFADLFDAVEMNAFYTSTVDFNRRAKSWAAEHGKPLVGNGDVHRLEQLDTTYSLVDAPPDADAICEAIRAGRVEVRRRPLSMARVTGFLARVFATEAIASLRPRPTPHAPADAEGWALPAFEPNDQDGVSRDAAVP